MATEAPPRPELGWSPRPLAVGLSAIAVALVVAVLVLGGTGALSAAGNAFDSGPALRVALPVTRVVHHLAAAVTIGLLVLAAWCVAPQPGTDRLVLSGPRQWLVRAATSASLVWVTAGVLVLVLTASDVTGTPVSAPGFATLVMSYVVQLDLGRAQLVSVVLVAVVVNLILLATRVATVAWAAVISLAALLPLALGGHAASAGDHMNSVDSLALHLVSVCLWVGGLAALVLVASRLGDQLPAVVGRYSTLALWCFVAVAASGVVNAGLRLGSFSALGSSYGLLVIGKTTALVALGLLGWAHRSATLRRLSDDRHAFARLAAVELVVMGATMGLAVALSRSAPPTSSQQPVDRVSELLGSPAPPPLTPERYFTVFYPDLLWLTVALGMLGLYLAGMVALRRRGDRWPVHRGAFWLAGCLLLVFVTSGGPGVYGRLHFSSHMLQHMILMVVIPFLLVLAAPVTLAMRTVPPRRDGSFGPRELLLQLVHSRVLRVVGHPVVAAVLFTAGLIAFYYTRLFPLSMSTHTGHVLMTAHFLLTGYVFVWSLVGVDPGPERPAYPYRLLLLLVTLGFHAFFGISLMSSGTVLAPEWWRALGQTDEAALLADQQNGGAIAWAAGDIPSLLLGVALVAGWVRSDARESRRLDRRADRDNDAELRRYNEQLAELARRDGSR